MHAHMSSRLTRIPIVNDSEIELAVEELQSWIDSKPNQVKLRIQTLFELAEHYFIVHDVPNATRNLVECHQLVQENSDAVSRYVSVEPLVYIDLSATMDRINSFFGLLSAKNDPVAQLELSLQTNDFGKVERTKPADPPRHN